MRQNNWQSTQDYRIKKRGDTYWARFSRKGRRVEVSLQTRNFLMAKAQVDEIESQLLSGKSWRQGEELFRDAWPEFLHDKQIGKYKRQSRAKTLYEYESFGRRYFLPFFGEDRIKDIDVDRWEQFLVWLKRNFGSIKVFNIHKYLRSFLTWAKAKGYLDKAPVFRNPDTVDDKPVGSKVYTTEELRLMRATSGDGRFHLYILMAQYMGMRPSEITQLKVDRIHLASKVIELQASDTKTARGRVIPIHEGVLGPLTKALEKSQSAFLFPNLRDSNRAMDKTGFKKAWLRMLKATGLTGKPYDLRHTFITRAIVSGVNPSMVAKIAGTSARVIEKHYLHLAPKDLHRALQAVDFFGSR